MTGDAETIANLRQSLAERDAEIRWLRDELRHADGLLRQMLHAPADGEPLVVRFTDPSKPEADE